MMTRLISRHDEFAAIVDHAAARHMVLRREVMDPADQRQPVAEARWHAMAMIKARYGLSYVRLARYFGRDHSSAMYGIARLCGYRRPKGQKGNGGASAAIAVHWPHMVDNLRQDAAAAIMPLRQAIPGEVSPLAAGEGRRSAGTVSVLEEVAHAA